MPQKCHSETHEHTRSDTYQLSCLPLAVERGNERGRQRERGRYREREREREGGEKKASVALATETCRVWWSKRGERERRGEGKRL